MPINKRIPWIVLLIFSGLFISSCSTTTTRPERPNIIFVFTDDHGSHSVSAYGSRILETPNMDRLASEGILFQNAFVTNSICAPSRGVLLTGKHSHMNGQLTNAQVFDGSQPTYPKALQEAGYKTALIGKWHLQSDPTGFDHWDILPGQGNYYNPVFITPEGQHQVEGYVTDIITDKVIDWIDSNKDGDQPFMINYHHKAPHRNWKPGPEQLGMFDGIDLPEPETLFSNWSGELTGGEIDEEALEGRTTGVRTQEMTLMNHFSKAWDLKFPPDSVMNEPYAQSWKNFHSRLTESQREAWDEAYDA